MTVDLWYFKLYDSQCLKYQRFTPTGCKDKEIDFVTKL